MFVVSHHIGEAVCHRGVQLALVTDSDFESTIHSSKKVAPKTWGTGDLNASINYADSQIGNKSQKLSGAQCSQPNVMIPKFKIQRFTEIT